MKKILILTTIILLISGLKPAISQIYYREFNFGNSDVMHMSFPERVDDPNSNIKYANIYIVGTLLVDSSSEVIIFYDTNNFPLRGGDFLDYSFVADWSKYSSYTCEWGVDYKTGSGEFAEYTFDQGGAISGTRNGQW